MPVADQWILHFDRALKTLSGQVQAARPSPALGEAEVELDAQASRHACGLMRVNHTGEICAQALYEGQALTAKSDELRNNLRVAAQEETDHLVWCEQRLTELDAKPSVLNPLFYGVSYALGAVTGLFGDKASLGFVEATEDQVCAHLDEHLHSLPAQDAKSRKIVLQMRADEARHGSDALDQGGHIFPAPVKALMRLVSRVMTETTYRI